MEELDFKEIFSIFWNRKLQIILVTLIFATIRCNIYYDTCKT